MANGLTDKSTIPLGVHDLRVVEGKPRFNDGRLALRLGLARNDWRALIKRHEAGAIERGLETLTHGAAKSSGGRPFEDWFLTIGQAIYYTARSEAKNALDVVAEVALIVEALRTGAPIPDTPFTDALFASERPTISRGDDNVVRVQHEFLPPDEPEEELTECELEEIRKSERKLDQRRREGMQGQLDFGRTPEDKALEDFAEPLAHNAFQREVWLEELDGISYPIIRERNREGNVCDIIFERVPAITTSTDGYKWPVPWINGLMVTLHLNHTIPMAIVERVYLSQLPESNTKDVARRTLSYFLAT